jgi:predicted nucleotidyltransferase
MPVGIVACGSILRGEAGATSDWDVHLIHLEPVRQRLQRWFHGVPAELFLNPPAALRSYFGDEHQRLRPCTAHMLATGFVVLRTDPVVDELLGEARMWLARPPQVDAATLIQRRYFAADLLDNARDLQARDPANARLLLDRAVYDMLEYSFWATPRMLPGQKALLATLTELTPETAALARRYLQTRDDAEAFALADQIADFTLGVRGFFPWTSPREAFPPDESQQTTLNQQ